LTGLSPLTVGASEKMGALAEVQTEILDQVTDVELESWGVTWEVVEVATRKKELEVLGGIYKSFVQKRRNNMQTIDKYWVLGWVEEFGEFYPRRTKTKTLACIVVGYVCVNTVCILT